MSVSLLVYFLTYLALTAIDGNIRELVFSLLSIVAGGTAGYFMYQKMLKQNDTSQFWAFPKADKIALLEKCFIVGVVTGGLCYAFFAFIIGKAIG